MSGMLRKLLIVLVLLGTGLYAYSVLTKPAPAPPDGFRIDAPPRQADFGRDAFPAFEFKEWSLTPVSAFDIVGRVLASKRYLFGNHSDLAPHDILIGWGDLSDSSVLKDMRFTLSDRYYTYRIDGLSHLSKDEIRQQTCNVHAIPKSEEIYNTLSSLKENHLVRIEGFLVVAEHPRGVRWTTSVTRDDDGVGSGELLYIERLTLYADRP